LAVEGSNAQPECTHDGSSLSIGPRIFALSPLSSTSMSRRSPRPIHIPTPYSPCSCRCSLHLLILVDTRMVATTETNSMDTHLIFARLDATEDRMILSTSGGDSSKKKFSFYLLCSNVSFVRLQIFLVLKKSPKNAVF
jgi:hypothetical protein